MSGILKKLLGRRSRIKGEITYEEAKELVRHHDVAVRSELAERNDIKPSLLYYLAEDNAAEVRRVIAANDRTPRQADRLLAEDMDDEVRCDLALKIGRLAPGLSEEERDQLQELTLEIIDMLAHDQLPRVRRIIAEEIKNCTTVPRRVIKALALDIELIVAAPVLEYSPLLSDDDLLEIIDSDPVRGALTSIANRPAVAEPVADAIAATENVEAVAALLANPSAQVREETLDDLIAAAPRQESWHKPLVERPDISIRAIRRIASFVALALLSVLEEKHKDLPREAVAEMREAVAKRIREAGVAGSMDSAIDADAAFKAGTLDDEMVIAALDRGDTDFVTQALALKAGIAVVTSRKVIGSSSGKSVTALCWAGGLGMRTAIQVQLRAAKVPPSEVVNAKDGIDYPYTDEDLQWQVDLFGV